MKRYFSLLALIIFTFQAARADVFDDVVQALKSGNAKEVSRFFNTNVELTILNDEGIYSRQQAEVVLRNFLTQHVSKAVSIQHRGASAQGAKYVIATYECSQGKYRAYIFMKDTGTGMLVHELRIEKD